MAVNPLLPAIDYTSRDYSSIRGDLIRLAQNRLPQWTASDPNDFGVALVEAVAYSVDQLHYYLDRVANEAYLGTALQRESLTAIARMMGYQAQDASPAAVTLEFTNMSEEDVVIPEGARVQATVEQTDGSYVRSFETVAPITVPAGVLAEDNYNTVTTTAIEGRTYVNETLGVSTGLVFQKMSIPRRSVLHETVEVKTIIDEVTIVWTQVLNIEDASDEDFSYVLMRETNGSTSVQFGDGINGEVPPLHSSVLVSYRVGGGVADVPANTATVLVEPVLPVIQVNNPQAATGGRNQESLNSIRINAARAFRSRKRAVTLYDFMTIAKASPGISKAKAVANNGVSVIVYVTADDDGTGSPTLTPDQEDFISSYLESASMAGVTVTVIDTLWIPVFLNLTVHCVPGSKRTEVTDTVYRVLERLFDFDNLDFDIRVTSGDVLTAFYQAPGVAYAEVGMLGTSPTAVGTGPLIMSSLAVNAIPYYERQQVNLTLVGGV